MVKQHAANFGFALTFTLALVAFDCAAAWSQDSATLASTTATASAVTYRVYQPTQRLEMIVNSSKILVLDKVVPRFQVQNETIVLANPVAPNQVQLSAQATGVTQINLWDAEDQLYTVDLIITGDARELNTVLQAQFPYATLRVTPLPTGAVIDGTVTDTDDIDRVIAVAEQFYPNVVNNIKVVGVQTILLHTRVMEVSRTKLLEAGIDWGGRGGKGMIAFGLNGMIDSTASTMGGIAASGPSTTRVGLISGGHVFDGLIRHLEQHNCAKILAEPTVVATHGRPSRFIVGGRFPIIAPAGGGQQSTVTFAEFGTSVDFLPFVVGPGRVRLEIRPEVSERDDANGVTLNGFTVPALRQRYVETAVEMQAGQTYAIAGLLQSRNETIVTGPPFLVSLPWVGTLFRKAESTENEIELLVTVTPELADAMDAHEAPCTGPGLNSRVPSCKELIFKGYVEVPHSDYVPECDSEGCMMNDCGSSDIQAPVIEHTPMEGESIMPPAGYQQPSQPGVNYSSVQYSNQPRYQAQPVRSPSATQPQYQRPQAYMPNQQYKPSVQYTSP